MALRSIILSLSLLAACSKAADAPQNPPTTPADPKLAALAEAPVDAVGAAKIELGKWLFFEPRLSSTGKMSCSTCHPPEKAWADGLVTSPKHDGSKNTRNTPTMYNVGSLDKLYWDGRAPSLEKNILAAWKAQMGGDPAAVAKALGAVDGYVEQFKTAAIDGPSEDGIVAGLAAFLRSLRSGNSPFDRWRAGQQDAVSADARRGYELFMGKAACAICHQEPWFTDRTFHNTGIGMDAAKPDVGAGGEKALNNPKLIGYFKTPTLREVAVTAPYFHDGSVATLVEAVRFMAGGGKDNPNKSPELIMRGLSDEEIGQLVAFLRTLTSDQKMAPPTLPH